MITSPDLPLPDTRAYEAGLMMFKYYGSADRYTKIQTHLDKFEVPSFIKENHAYQMALVYDYNQQNDIECIHLGIETDGYTGYLAPLKNIFHQKKPNISIVLFDRCDDF